MPFVAAISVHTHILPHYTRCQPFDFEAGILDETSKNGLESSVYIFAPRALPCGVNSVKCPIGVYTAPHIS